MDDHRCCLYTNDRRDTSLQCIEPKKNKYGKKASRGISASHLQCTTHGSLDLFLVLSFIFVVLSFNVLARYQCSLFPSSHCLSENRFNWSMTFQSAIILPNHYITICAPSKQSVKYLKLCLVLPLTVWISQRSDASFHWIKHTKGNNHRNHANLKLKYNVKLYQNHWINYRAA